MSTSRTLGIGGHHGSAWRPDNLNRARYGRTSVEWLTPKWILDALGEFDLDPCASAVRPWPTARRHLTVRDDGLAHEWQGRVWLNPPYGEEAKRWLARLAGHGRGTALLFARTETEMFHEHVWPVASGVLFLRGRLTFHKPDGSTRANAGGPSVLIAYGRGDNRRLRSSGLPGIYVPLDRTVAFPGRCSERTTSA